MLSKVMQLEALKQKGAMVGILVILAATILVVNAEAYISHRDFREVLSALSTVLMVAGVPLLAVLLGGNAGIGLRGQTARGVEEMLPFSPVRKVMGAYLASLLYLAALGSALIGGGFALSDAGSLESIEVPVLLIPAMSIVLHLFSFLFCYWLGQPFFGGGLAILLSGTLGYLLFVLYSLRWIIGRAGVALMEDTYIKWMAAALLAGAGGAMASVIILARRIEHEKRLWLAPGLAASVLVSLCLPISFAPIRQLQHHVNEDMSPVFFFGWLTDVMDPTGQIQSHLGDGLILETTVGSVIRVAPDGSRQTLYRAPEVSLLDIVPVLRHYSVDLWTTVAFSSDGSTWILTQPDPQRAPNLYEVRVADSSGQVKHLTTFQVNDYTYPRIASLGENVGLWNYSDEKRSWMFADIPREGQQPVWSETGFGYNDWIARGKWAADRGLLASVAEDQTTVVLKRKDGSQFEWTLPGPAVIQEKRDRYLVPLYGKEAQPSFVLPVQDEGRNMRLYICRPDGSVQRVSDAAWPVSKTGGLVLRMIPGGGMLWRQDIQNPQSVMVVDPEGKAYPIQTKGLVPTSREGYRFAPRRLSGDRLWATYSDHFIVINLASGKLEKDYGEITSNTLNEFYSVFGRSTKEGIYRVADGRIQLITWEGARKDLGSATMD